MATEVENISFNMESNRKPQKKYYRQRAHTNPLADHSFEYPVKPSEWKECCNSMYNLPQNQDSKKVTFADIGCGYGGLLVSLSKMFPNNLALGMEIRVKVSDYVIDVSNIFTCAQLVGKFFSQIMRLMLKVFLYFFSESKLSVPKTQENMKTLHVFAQML